MGQKAAAPLRSVGWVESSLATFDGPARVVRCAMAIVRALRSLGLGVGAGVHTGEVEQGVAMSEAGAGNPRRALVLAGSVEAL